MYLPHHKRKLQQYNKFYDVFKAYQHGYGFEMDNKDLGYYNNMAIYLYEFGISILCTPDNYKQVHDDLTALKLNIISITEDLQNQIFYLSTSDTKILDFIKRNIKDVYYVGDYTISVPSNFNKNGFSINCILIHAMFGFNIIDSKYSEYELFTSNGEQMKLNFYPSKDKIIIYDDDSILAISDAVVSYSRQDDYRSNFLKRLSNHISPYVIKCDEKMILADSNYNQDISNTALLINYYYLNEV